MANIIKELGLSNLTKNEKKFSQEFVPIKDIEDGIIITNDDRYVKVMEIMPNNLEMMSNDDQNRVLSFFYSLLKSGTMPNRFQIKCTTNTTDIDEYLEAVYFAREKETGENIRLTQDNYMAFIDNYGKFGSVEHHFYFIFAYERQNVFLQEIPQEEILRSLELKFEALKREFISMGNHVLTPQDPTYETAEFLYNHYNPRTKLHSPFQTRVERIMQDTMKVNEFESESSLPPVDIRDLVAPKSVDTKQSPHYMLLDGMYKAYFYIDKNGFPETISPDGWLAGLINFGLGFDVDLFFSKRNSAEVLSQIYQRQKFGKIISGEKSDDSKDSEERYEHLSGISYLRAAIKQGREDLFDMSVIITVSAYSEEDLLKREEELAKFCQRADINLVSGKNLQEELFFSVAPICDISPKIEEFSKHNLTTSGVAVSYPFSTFSLADKQGVVMGINSQNRSLVCYDNFDTNKYPNANIGIYGGSGRGKTYSLLCLLERFRCLGNQSFIFAPIKQHEFLRVAEAVDGLFVDMAPGSGARINPLEIWELDSPDEQLLGGEFYDCPCFLTDKIDNLTIWFNYIIPDLNKVEKSKIKAALIKTYERFGITKDNDSIYNDVARKIKKKMPVLSNFVSELKAIFDQDTESISKKRKAEILEILKDAITMFDGETNVDLTNKFIVFGLERVNPEWQPAVMSYILEFVWDVIRADRTKRQIIAMDEGWLLLKEQQMADFVIKIFKVIRGFGGASVFSTQSVMDLYRVSKDVANAIVGCSNSSIIVGMERKDVELLSAELEITAAEKSKIISFTSGDAILIAGANHIPLNIKASDYEHELFTTKREDLARIAEKRRQQQ